MDWNAAVEKHHTALKWVLAGLRDKLRLGRRNHNVVMLGLAPSIHA